MTEPMTAATAEDGSTVPDSYWDEEAHPREEGGPTAGQWVPVGKARDEAGAKAQQDKGASKNYDELLHGSSSGQAKQLTAMNDDDLKKLTAFVYSSKSDDPAVVRGRMSVAAEMGKRGLDVKDYGALGGGIDKPKGLKASVTELSAERGTDGAWRFPAMVAAAIPAAPPAAWFAQRPFDGPTPLTFTADGQVYGHIADRAIPHIGLPGHRTAPRSPSRYRWYHTGQVRCDDDTLVATGRITMGAGHASLDASAEAATAHYDNTAAAVADVVAWDDEHGVAVAGAARPGTTPDQMRAAMASPPSGDWRVIGNDLEMVAALLVNVPGFPTPRAGIAASGAVMARVA
ncbi:MAG: hypothetical protein L0I76_26880, partial [Pseudonocardia sp.]|nr:hypothetical protein [Pseudonocardia sp.]